MKAYHQVAGAGGAYAAFRFEADGQATAWVMRDSYCEDPLCPGPEAEVILIAGDDPSRRVEFRIDLIEARAHWEKDLPSLDQEIVREFTRNRWVVRLMARHRSLVRAWGLSRWRGGPAVAVEDRCYGLDDFDAKGDQHAMPFESGGRGWYAFDQYCVIPSCECQDAVLLFAEENRNAEKVLPVSFSVRLDLHGAGATDTSATGVPLTDGQRRVVADFLDELGAWKAELGLRRQLVRRIAAIRLEVELVPPPALRQAGRNEPCPCGSGRKFKLCCGSRKRADAAGPPPLTLVPGQFLPTTTRWP